MNKTPWTKGPSSLPSDRLRPKNTPTPTKSSKQPAAAEISKSKQVKDLEALIANLDLLTHPTRDPRGGCFCLAREHQLSPYNPLCTSCGLILCTFNKPYHTCPHCSSPLHTLGQRTSILDELRTTLSSTLIKEQLARENLIEQAKKAAGAFPTLSSSTPPPTLPTPTPFRPTQETHKVLSLTSSNKKQKGGRKPVTVTSYTTTPTSSLPVSRISTPNPEEDIRVPSPPQTVEHATKRRTDPARPWQNLALEDTGGGVKYIPAPALAPTATPEAEGSSTKSQSRGARRKANQKSRTDENAVAGSKHSSES
ncbi:hypothetical protein P691DRAFT_677454 [Macrolepiota fuliginosa MF-IS2]|uniref:TRIP4/RQT4 C2HC5-type zinc finger domain-containing protein n=1 Tax=Macrolepiota fuliginosa MF-IS2 TaxID=1400762 RepID=A0A9P5X4T9_9AGAR|nr:hypothetical protein P691DRAFT_677454 [Macrolepiota fuliginosa MF-IS2]